MSEPILPRRDFVAGSASLAVAATTIPRSARAAPDTQPVAETTTGRLRGRIENGVFAFRGVPYAQAARFAPPEAVPPWPGERDALAPGATAPQLPGQSLPVFRYYQSDVPQSEDCLTLAVHTPALRGDRRRPVLVWLHGGAWTSGAGTAPVFDGASLAREEGVVLVSVNHRLNLFGFFHTGEAEDGVPEGSGNNGVLDMIAALRWVRDNIAAFGGDPGSVTIFGQSGGAAKVSALLAAPAAQGLFHRAIMQSGSGALSLAAPGQAARAAHALLAQFDLGPRDAAKLRDQPAANLLSAMAKVVAANGGANDFRPVLDHAVFQQNPFDPTAATPARDVPLLIGSAETEVTFYLAPDPRNWSLSAEQMRARVKRFVRLDDAATDRLIAAYRDARPQASPSDLLVAICTDQNYRMSMIRAAELKAAAGGAPAYSYLFTWRSPAMEGVLRTPHTSEVPFVFGNSDTARALTGNGPELPALRRRMMALWASFARDGRPSGEDVPDWPAYDPERRPTMLLGNKAQLVNDPHGAERRAIAAVPRFDYGQPVTFTHD